MSIVKEFCSNVILYHYNTLLVEESQSAVSPPEAFWTSALWDLKHKKTINIL